MSSSTYKSDDEESIDFDRLFSSPAPFSPSPETRRRANKERDERIQFIATYGPKKDQTNIETKKRKLFNTRLGAMAYKKIKMMENAKPESASRRLDFGEEPELECQDLTKANPVLLEDTEQDVKNEEENPGNKEEVVVKNCMEKLDSKNDRDSGFGLEEVHV